MTASEAAEKLPQVPFLANNTQADAPHGKYLVVCTEVKDGRVKIEYFCKGVTMTKPFWNPATALTPLGEFGVIAETSNGMIRCNQVGESRARYTEDNAIRPWQERLAYWHPIRTIRLLKVVREAIRLNHAELIAEAEGLE